MESLSSPIRSASFDLIRDLARSLRLFQENAVICYNVTFTQFVILDFACQRKPLHLGDLHKLLGVEKSTTSRLIKPLIEKGLLEKTRSYQDKRSYDLYLSEKGQEAYSIVWGCFSDAIDRFFSAVPEKEQLHIASSIQMISKAFLTCCGKDDCCK